MRNLKISAAAMIMVLALQTTVWAQTENNSENGQKSQMECKQNNKVKRPGNRLEMLNLSDEQKQKVEKLEFEHQKKVLPIRNQLGEKQAKLRTLTTAEAPDTKAINSLIDEMGLLKTQLMKERVNMQLAIRALLTEEQRLKFDTQCQKGNGRGEGRNGHRNNRDEGMGNSQHPDFGDGTPFEELDEDWI